MNANDVYQPHVRLPSGLFVPAPKETAKASGFYVVEHFRKGDKIDEFIAENTTINEGLIAALNIMFAGTSVISNWYCAVAQNNYTPVATDTASSIVGNFGEFTGYSGGARPNFTPTAASGSPTISNSASKATFNFTGSATLTGAFLISSATPGSNTGTLYSAALFGANKPVANTDQITLTYQTALTSS